MKKWEDSLTKPENAQWVHVMCFVDLCATQIPDLHIETYAVNILEE